MTTTQTTSNPLFTGLMARLDLNETQAADYLGVPIFTLRKWVNGTRTPSASVIRLLDVLGMVEAMNPALHDSFLPNRKS